MNSQRTKGLSQNIKHNCQATAGSQRSNCCLLKGAVICFRNNRFVHNQAAILHIFLPPAGDRTVGLTDPSSDPTRKFFIHASFFHRDRSAKTALSTFEHCIFIQKIILQDHLRSYTNTCKLRRSLH